MENIQVFQGNMPVHEQTERAHIDIQISTAKRYPRDLKKVIDNAITIVTSDARIAQSCGYELPKAHKSIQGPSVHMARIVAQQYGNLRAEARGIEIGDVYITSEAVAFDLETNYACKVEVRLKIVDKYGKRFSDDVIASNILGCNARAFRNAVFNVVPKNITDAVYEAAQRKITGDLSTEDKLLAKRKNVIAGFSDTYGVSLEELLKVVGRTREEHLGAEQLKQLIGLAQAIKDGDTTVDDSFGRNDGKDNPDGETVKRLEDEFIDDGPVIVVEEEPDTSGEKAPLPTTPVLDPKDKPDPIQRIKDIKEQSESSTNEDERAVVGEDGQIEITTAENKDIQVGDFPKL